MPRRKHPQYKTTTALLIAGCIGTLLFCIWLFKTKEFSPKLLQDSSFSTLDEAPFGDVPLDYKYVGPIAFLKDFGVIKGYDDGSFQPDQSLTRAEFLKIIILGMGMALEDVPKATSAPFSDVQMTDWFVDYVAYGTKNDYIQGYPDGTFRPNDAINKAEALKILGELVEWDSDSLDLTTLSNPYSDVDLTEWYGKYVAYAIDRNLLDDDGTTLNIGTAITRGQVTEYLYRDYVCRTLGVDRYAYDYDTEILGYDRQTNPGGTPYTPNFAPVGTIGDDDYATVSQLIYDEFIAENYYKDELIAFMEPIPYPAGDEIGIFDLQETDGVREEVTLPKAYWVAYIDFAPNTPWEHPGIMVLVDAETYDTDYTEITTWPMHNGAGIWATLETRIQTDLWIYPTDEDLTRLEDLDMENETANLTVFRKTTNGIMPIAFAADDDNNGIDDADDTAASEKQQFNEEVELIKKERELYGERTAADFASPCPVPNCETEGKKIALLIDGFDEEDVRHSGDPDKAKWRLKSFYENLKDSGYDTTYVTSAVGADKSDVPTDMDEDDLRFTTKTAVIEAFEDAAAKIDGCCDEVIVVIMGHGSPDGLIDMNSSKRYEDYEWQKVYDATLGKNILKKIKTGYHTSGNSAGGYFTTSDLRDLLNLLKTCQVYVFIESCYSGIHLEENAINGDLPSEGCLCRSVYTSSTKDRVSYLTGFTYPIQQAFAAGKKVAEAMEAAAQFADKVLGDFPQAGFTSTTLCDDDDDDGLCNGKERERGMDPTSTDSDDDGILDADEWTYDPLISEGATNPTDPDTDDDKLTDGEEKEAGTNPFKTDTDADDLSDWHEVHGGTDPLNPDTDGDNCTDGAEIKDGTNPRDAESKGLNCSDTPVIMEINPELREEFEIEGHTFKFGWMGYDSTFDIWIDGEKYNKKYGEIIDLGNGVTITVEWNSDHTMAQVTVQKS